MTDNLTQKMENAWNEHLSIHDTMRQYILKSQNYKIIFEAGFMAAFNHCNVCKKNNIDDTELNALDDLLNSKTK